MRKRDKHTVRMLLLFQLLNTNVSTLLNKIEARTHMLSVFSFEKKLLKRSHFHSNEAHRIPLKHTRSEWNKRICARIQHGCSALLSALDATVLRYFQFDSRRTFFRVIRSACSSCFYGNKYTITNTEATKYLRGLQKLCTFLNASFHLLLL